MNTTIVENHIIHESESVRSALSRLDKLAADAILFVVDEKRKLIGSLTDGDLRRGFIKNLSFEDPLVQFVQKNPVSIIRNNYTLPQLEEYKRKNFKIIPILNEEGVIIDILNFRLQSTIIPADAVLMAGGKGSRLRPLTEKIPKPLLRVGDKPIIEHNINRLLQVGITTINISVNYLGECIISYFGDGSLWHADIHYLRESKPLGTIGSVLLIDHFDHEDILVMNSDLLTNIDFADFYTTFKNSGADMAVAASPYYVEVPYAVLQVDEENKVISFSEKPRYTHYSNAGIYFMKKELLGLIPKDQFYDITDLMNAVLQQGKNLITYPITGYWLDIGHPEDYKKAQEDIGHIKW